MRSRHFGNGRLARLVALPFLIGSLGCATPDMPAASSMQAVTGDDRLLSQLDAFLADSRREEQKMTASGGSSQSSVVQQSSGGGQSSSQSSSSTQQSIDNGDGTVTVQQILSGNGISQTIRQTVNKSAPGKPVRFDYEKIQQSGCVQQTMRRTGSDVEIIHKDTCDGKPLSRLKGTIQGEGGSRRLTGTMTAPDGRTQTFDRAMP